MVKTGMDRIFISVGDMNKSLGFYRDWMGMKVVADQSLEADKIQQLWKLPEGTKAQAVYLQKDEQPTLVELIEFQPHSSIKIREGIKVYDYGVYDFGIIVRDVNKTYNDLIGKGFKFTSVPPPFTPDWAPIDVTEGLLIGPDEEIISHLEIRNPRIEVKEDYGIMYNYSQIVEDIDEVIKFYRDILGFTLWDELVVPQKFVDKNWIDLLRIKSGTEVRMAFLLPGREMRMAFLDREGRGSKTPVLEFLQYSVKGKPLGKVARPPNLGIFMNSFETDDLYGLMRKFMKEGVKVLSGPVEMEVAPHGKINAITVEGPSKVMIEFFEK